MKDTKKPQANCEMWERNKFFCAISHHAADAMFIHDFEGRFLDVNDRACETLGYSREQLLTMRVADVDIEFGSEKHKSRFWSQLNPAKTITLEGVHQRKDGSTFPVEVRLSLLELGGRKNILSLVRNITDRKLAEEKLRETREKLEGVLASVTDHMSMIDTEHNIVWANNVAERLFGSHLTGKKCYSAYHGFDRACQPCVVKACFEDGQVHEHETEVVTPEGNRMVFWCTASVSCRHGDGTPKLVVEVSRDVTDRKIAEEKLLSYHHRLRQLGSQLSLAEEKERRRIANEVHDHIGQNLAFAKMKLKEYKQSHLLSHGSTIIEEVIAFIDATIQNTRSLVSEIGSPILYELGFEPAVQWLVKQTRQKCDMNIRFQNDDFPKPLQDDVKVFLYQAVRELLANVVKHSKASNCLVSLKIEEEKIRVDVNDDGIGFEGNKIDSSGMENNGFGFFSIRERLEPLGGSLCVHSKPNKGTEITLLAPLVS